MVVFALISCATLDFTRPVSRDLAVLCFFILQYLKYELFNSNMSGQFFAVQLKTVVFFGNHTFGTFVWSLQIILLPFGRWCLYFKCIKLKQLLC